MEELKPCPFCGGKPCIVHSHLFSNEYEVRCSFCGSRTMIYKSYCNQSAKLNAIQAWNRRTNDKTEKDAL